MTATRKRRKRTEPPRPLGTEGSRVWDAYVGRVSDLELLLVLAQTCDERELLRPRVLRGDVSDRNALRTLEARIGDLRTAVERDASWTAYSR
jgi:hypothetical protein